MIGASEARRLVKEMAGSVVEAIDGEIDRKRENACEERVFHAIMAKEGRRIWRPWHRWLARRLDARCRAKAATCPVSSALVAEAAKRGLL